jgi:hypothetical protein
MNTSTFRPILSRLVIIISFCLSFIFTSCNSSKYFANAHYKKNRKHGSLKCNHVKTLYLNQDNQVPGMSQNIKDKSDFTLIILKEKNDYYHPDTSIDKSKDNNIPPTD